MPATPPEQVSEVDGLDQALHESKQEAMYKQQLDLALYESGSEEAMYKHFEHAIQVCYVHVHTI